MTTKKTEEQIKGIVDRLTEIDIEKRILIEKVKLGRQQSKNGQVISELELERCIAEWFQVIKE